MYHLHAAQSVHQLLYGTHCPDSTCPISLLAFVLMVHPQTLYLWIRCCILLLIPLTRPISGSAAVCYSRSHRRLPISESTAVCYSRSRPHPAHLWVRCSILLTVPSHPPNLCDRCCTLLTARPHPPNLWDRCSIILTVLPTRPISESTTVCYSRLQVSGLPDVS